MSIKPDKAVAPTPTRCHTDPMCGRFSLTTELAILRDIFGFDGPALNLKPRWDTAPTQDAPGVRLDGGVRRAVTLRRSLVPYLAEELSAGSRTINARGPTRAQKPAFKAADRA